MHESVTQLREIRSTGLEPPELAKRLHVGQATIYNWLNGTTPRKVYRPKIAALWRKTQAANTTHKEG